MELSIYRYSLVYTVSRFFAFNFSKNINQSFPFYILYTFAWWSLERSIIHMTVQISIFATDSYSVGSTGFFRLFVLLSSLSKLRICAVRWFICLLNACCRQHRITCTSQHQNKFSIILHLSTSRACPSSHVSQMINMPKLRWNLPGFYRWSKRILKRCEENKRLMKVVEKPGSFPECRSLFKRAPDRAGSPLQKIWNLKCSPGLCSAWSHIATCTTCTSN